MIVGVVEEAELSLRSPRCEARHRLLPPEHVTRLVRGQDDTCVSDFTCHVGRLDRSTAYDARAAGASMRLVHAIGAGQTLLREPDTYLLAQLLR